MNAGRQSDHKIEMRHAKAEKELLLTLEEHLESNVA